MAKTRSRYSEQYPFALEWPSVTEVVGQLAKPFLYVWYGKVGWAKANHIFQESKKIGSLLHYEICEYFEDTDISRPDVVLEDPESKRHFYQALQNFHKFARKYKPTSLMAEKVVYSKKHGYIGTFDRLLKVGGKPVLVDWKTSSGIGYDYVLQLEAYYRALTEMGLCDTLNNRSTSNCLWVVRLPKKEEIDLEKDVLKFKPNKERYNKGFLTLLEYYKQEKREKQKEKK